MDDNLREELFNWHLQNDPLFRRLAEETTNELDDNKFQMNLALLHLTLEGKVAISQDNFGTLLFSESLMN